VGPTLRAWGGPAASGKAAEGGVRIEADGGPDANSVGGPAASGKAAEGGVRIEADGGPDAKSVGGPAASGKAAEGGVRIEADGGPDANVRSYMFITKKHISRRSVLCGFGVSLTLPFMESMLPAMTQTGKSAAGKTPVRVVCAEMVHGAAGSTKYGVEKNMWSPAQAGTEFDLAPTSLIPLEPYKDYLTIVSNTDMHPAEAYEPPEIGGDHFRSSSVFLTQAHPKQTQSSDVLAGTSFDQVYAQKFGQETPIPSLQLCIESAEGSGGCDYNYSCVYLDTISWESPTKPLTMIRDPRMVFDQMFGVGTSAEQRAMRRKADRSILDWVSGQMASLKSELGPADRARFEDYTESIREIERRIARIEQQNAGGEARELPLAPIGVPDNWTEHVKLMFDLQTVAFAGNITRVAAIKLSRDVSGRTFPESGVTSGFHTMSHHGENPQRLAQYAQINKYHVSMIAYLAEKLKKINDGDGSLLDHSVIVYGSPMGDSNLHNHKRVPMFVMGHAGGQLKGHRHVLADDGTPAANIYLTLLRRLGIPVESFGNSTGELEL